MPYRLVSKRIVQEELGISPSSLKNWRLGRQLPSGGVSPPRLIEGVHWLRVGPRKILYNLELIRDFLYNQQSPAAHRQAIAAYLQSLPSAAAAPPRLDQEKAE